MDLQGYLQSDNNGLVADVEGVNKNPGAQVIAMEKNNDINQLWTYEDGRLISNLNGLAMERDGKANVCLISCSIFFT